MTTEEKNAILRKNEEAIVIGLKKTGIYLLEKSIDWFEDSETLLSVANIQIAMELLLKA